MECPVRWFRDCLSGPHLLVPFLSCGFDAGRGHSYFCFFFLPSSSFFLISPRLDFSFYNVVIPELCFLFYNNRGHYTGLILVCIPFSVFERNFVFYSMHPSGAIPFMRVRYRGRHSHFCFFFFLFHVLFFSGYPTVSISRFIMS